MKRRRSAPKPRRFDGTLDSVIRYMRSLIPDERTGCQVWEAGTATNNGYGRFNLRLPEGGYRGRLAHRASWEEANGASIPPGMEVLHSCDNPPCVNPAHLTLGTHAENMADMARKGRGTSKSATQQKELNP